MRLLDPDVGEVLDRMSILDLKIDVGMQKGVSTEAWEQEREALNLFLQKKIQAWQSTATAQTTEDWMGYNAQLKNTNLALWRAEDDIRALRKEESLPEFYQEVALVALRIADLNDARANLVKKLNAVFGVHNEEKIYNVQ